MLRHKCQFTKLHHSLLIESLYLCILYETFAFCWKLQLLSGQNFGTKKTRETAEIALLY